MDHNERQRRIVSPAVKIRIEELRKHTDRVELNDFSAHQDLTRGTTDHSPYTSHGRHVPDRRRPIVAADPVFSP
jgi:hypothetical protein